MKIAYLVNQMSAYGGVEKITTDKINYWIRFYNYQVVLITLSNLPAKFAYDLDSRVIHYDLSIEPVPRLMNLIAFLVKVYKILTTERVDILFTTLTSAYSLLLPLIKVSIPKVLEFHSSGISLNKKTWWLKRIFIKRYKKVVLLNRDESVYYRLGNICVIPNFIHLDMNTIDIFRGKEKVILAIGRIHEDRVKQFDHLVEIWALIARDNPDWQVHLYGDYSSIQEIDLIINLVKEKKLEDSFIYKGASNNISAIMRQSSVLAMTSKTECFPMVILEAMNAGLAIISYDSPNGPRNMISDKISGLLVTLNDKIGYAEGLHSLINDENMISFLSQNSVRRAAYFSDVKIMDHWNHLVSELLK